MSKATDRGWLRCHLTNIQHPLQGTKSLVRVTKHLPWCDPCHIRSPRAEAEWGWRAHQMEVLTSKPVALLSLLCQSFLSLWAGVAAVKYKVHCSPQLMRRALLSFPSWLAMHQLAFQPASTQPRAFSLCPSVMSAHLHFPEKIHSILEKYSCSQPWIFSVPYQDPIWIPVNSYATILDVFGAFNLSWNWMNEEQNWNGYGTCQPWTERINRERLQLLSSAISALLEGGVRINVISNCSNNEYVGIKKLCL